MDRIMKVASACLLLVLAGCEEEERGAQEAARGEQEAVQVWSLRSQPPDIEPRLGDRMPASPDITMLIPATTLFPGGVAVVPEVANPYAGDAQAIAAGERHFAAFNCAGCHAPLGAGGMGPPLGDGKWIYGGAPAQIFLSIVHGRPDGMPAWGAMLPQRTVWELVAYIESLPDIEDPAGRLGFEDNFGRFRGGEAEARTENGGATD